jgi:ribosomal protein L15
MKTDHITGGSNDTHPTKRLGRGRGNGRGKTCTEYAIVNVGDLEKVEGVEIIDKEALVKAGLIRSNSERIKILGNGELKGAVRIKADKFSKSASDKIVAAGGEIVAE